MNEGMTLAVTGLLGGIAGGSAVGGWMAEHGPGTAGFAAPVAAAALALLIASLPTTLRHPPVHPVERRTNSRPAH